MDKRHKEGEASIRKQFNLTETAQIHVCLADDMHPYNCDGAFGGECIHCDQVRDEDHNPDTCAFR